MSCGDGSQRATTTAGANWFSLCMRANMPSAIADKLDVEAVAIATSEAQRALLAGEPVGFALCWRIDTAAASSAGTGVIR